MAVVQRRALFLDRDGTLVHPYHYPSRPEHLQLYPDIGPELHTLQKMGFALIVITNQSGIARGYFTVADLDRMHDYLSSELSRWDVHLDAIYYCPHHPHGIIPELAISCDCRKPEPGMLLQAAQEHSLDLAHSWFVGDILDDVEAGNRAGCSTILVDIGSEKPPASVLRTPTFVAPNTRDALRIIRTVTELNPDLDLVYRPQSWRTTAVASQNNLSQTSQGAGMWSK
jgi:D-glycero-D-manno-heptose 1,7-bisphosphate phosphatase